MYATENKQAIQKTNSSSVTNALTNPHDTGNIDVVDFVLRKHYLFKANSTVAFL